LHLKKKMIHVLLFYFIYINTQTQPQAWCSPSYAWQNRADYSLCNRLEIKEPVTSWCNIKNTFTKQNITFKDNLYKNCSDSRSNCLHLPHENFSFLSCQNNFCKIVNSVQPFDLNNRPFLLVSVQKGLFVIDMATENVQFLTKNKKDNIHYNK
jgi:hypothetical protein